jgi:hypothetical protein
MLNKSSRLKRTAVVLLVNAALLCAVLAAVEIFFHIFPVLRIEWIEGDEKVGFHIAPDCSLRVDFKEHAGGYYVYRSNNLGFREDRATEVAARDSVRIVVLGDSHTDGACWNSQSYPHRLEHYLNQRNPRCPAEVINAGNGKYSPFQYLRAYQYRVKSLHPDIVIVGFYIGNDFFDMFRRDDRPSLRIGSDGQVTELPPDFFFYSRPGFSSSPLAKSYVYYILFGGRLWKDLSYTVSRSFVFIRNARSIDKVSTGDLLAYFHDLYRLTRLNRPATTQSLSSSLSFITFRKK